MNNSVHKFPKRSILSTRFLIRSIISKLFPIGSIVSTTIYCCLYTNAIIRTIVSLINVYTFVRISLKNNDANIHKATLKKSDDHIIRASVVLLTLFLLRLCFR